MNATAAQAVERARLLLLQRESFLGVLAMHLGMIERSDIETAATDGKAIFYNPDYVLSLSEKQRIFLWAHEIWHCALSHPNRLGARDLGKANEAMDYAVNGMLIKAGIGEPFPGALVDSQYDGMGWEEIYAVRAAKARKQAQQQGAGAPAQPQPGNGQPGQPQPGAGAPSAGAGQPQGQPGASAQPGQPGAPSATPGQAQPGAAGQPGSGNPYGPAGVMKPGKGTDAECAASADDWQIKVRQAAAIAKSRNAGTMPGNAQRTIDELNSPAVDYRELLADLINSRVAIDFSMARPNRRFVSAGFYLPGIVSDAIDHLVFAVDTSGSIDQTMLANCAAEIVGAMESGKVRKLTVIFADAAVRAVQEFELGDDIKLVPAGGGGTRFDDTFRWIAEHAPDATAIVYLTDMICSQWGAEPDCPVFWAVHGSRAKFDKLASAAPFGDAVYIGRLG